MGFDNRSEGKYFTILNTKNGAKFSQRVQEGTEGAVSRVNKLNKLVWEKYHDSFTAKLVDIKVTDGAYGKSWEFHFRDNGEIFKLQLGYSNGYATALLKMLPNADLTKEMKLSPSSKEVDGKNKTSLFINQDGVALKHAYTKDVPNGMPAWKKITVKGVDVWDDTDVLVFLKNMVDTKILPQLASVKPVVSATSEPKDALTGFVDEAQAEAKGEDEPF